MIISDIERDFLKKMASDLMTSYEGVEIKKCHAHEIVAAFFGYKSRASLLHDENFSIINKFNSLVEKRIEELNGLPENLPSAEEINKKLLYIFNWWAQFE